MTTPNFTANSPIFGGVNVLFIGTPQFQLLLRAINSSEEIRSRVKAFADAGGTFRSGGSFDEDGSALDPRLHFVHAKTVDGVVTPPSIQMSDDYFVLFRDDRRTEEVRLAEQVRVVGHEVSHASRSEAVLAENNAAYQTYWDSNRNQTAINNYVNSSVTIGVGDESRAYADDWNNLARAGFTRQQIVNALPEEQRGMAQFADPVTNLIDVSNAAVMASARAFICHNAPCASP